MSTTIKDVAEMAGVSIATVSKFLNNIRISQENAVNIEESIKALNYQKNEIASGLKVNRTKTVGVIVPRLVDVFSTDIVVSVEDRLSRLGYNVLVCDCGQDPQIMCTKLKLLLGKKVDGLIVFPLLESKELIDELRKVTIPIVIVDQKIEGFDTVRVDNEGASFEVTDYLISKGHEKIAIICGPVFNYTSIERYKGYTKAFRERDMDIPRQFVFNTDYTTSGGYGCFMDIWKGPDKPTAVFGTNYQVSLGILLAAREMNLKIGKDFSFFSFDNFELAQIVDPPLSTIIQETQLMGKEVSEIFLKRMNREANENNIIERVVPTRIIYTDSVTENSKI